MENLRAPTLAVFDAVGRASDVRGLETAANDVVQPQKAGRPAVAVNDGEHRDLERTVLHQLKSFEGKRFAICRGWGPVHHVGSGQLRKLRRTGLFDAPPQVAFRDNTEKSFIAVDNA